ncbi:MAG TPA: methylenetetrahydrofolate--tRNA-(uracil(54)-C(5))-methyltransferase (FADH(2)-oxidizing) TrmFO, partial [Deinococcales bacterium]|nr:methylenetetrahydrofolate--tRNA-(uracil(54)-C(5))-methyltransferase (FADH(2)-oxidizing) TrmFO [Deinococcales bacterium]
NCPMNREEYAAFHEAVENARRHTPHDWDTLPFFEGCMPIEEIARRGFDTPRFGPMKPKGLKDPRTGREPFACVQLRREDADGRLWSLVGFQTGLAWPEQLKVVRLIPGLQNAVIARYGVMHRNTYLNAPKLLDASLRFRAEGRVLAAGVLAGTEGYLESAATGWLAGLNAARLALGLEALRPPETTMLGGLTHFLATANPKNFQPMNASWSLVPELPAPDRPGKRPPKRSEQRPGMAERALADMTAWWERARAVDGEAVTGSRPG